MLKKSISLTFVLLAISAFAATITLAQSTTERKSGWAARALNPVPSTLSTETKREAEAVDVEATEASTNAVTIDVIERAREARRKALVGTYLIHIPISASGVPAFNAYHSYHYGGTFTEVSDLLPGLAETPAKGVWDLDSGGYALTFELFVFDLSGAPVGRVRVRCFLRLAQLTELTGEAIVDFIEPDGTVILDIDRTPFTGKKLAVLIPR